jgi:hypothetical protein
VKINFPEDARRAHGDFGAPYTGMVNRERQKNIRVSKCIMVEEIASSCAEVVGIDCPSLDGDSDSEVVLLITFPRQGMKSKP